MITKIHLSCKEPFCLSIVLFLALSLLLGLSEANNFAQAESGKSALQTWRDPGLAVSSYFYSCNLPSSPDSLVIGQQDDGKKTPSGSFSYNFVTGEKKWLSNVVVQACLSEVFFGYYQPYYQGSGSPRPQAYRFSLKDSQLAASEKPIDHFPEAVATDGSTQLYSLERDPNDYYNTRLWYSPDGGLTWQERGKEFKGSLQSIAVAATNAKVLYAVSAAYRWSSNFQVSDYTLYFSSDAGESWQARYKDSFQGGSFRPSVSVTTLSGSVSAEDTVLLELAAPGAAIGFTTHLSLSTDGAKTFTPAGESYSHFPSDTQPLQTSTGIIRLHKELSSGYTLLLLGRNSTTWQKLTLPFDATSRNLELSLQQDQTASDNIFISQTMPNPQTEERISFLWFSPDGGSSWQQVSQGWKGNSLTMVKVISYSPLSLVELGYASSFSSSYPKLLVLDRQLRMVGVAPDSKPDSLYFPKTGHNLSGIFKTYWLANGPPSGGLMQFGYPLTEVFTEVNPADGKPYPVQYFERNRFEYHAELAGTPFEVLLGLLGNQLTEARRQAGELPFQSVKNPSQPEQWYFGETGHTLKGKFKAYWLAHGGLMLYGYPISEEFQEVNPDDGQTYLVQYFERNRFEYHPKLAGTRFEVLLGLLGKSLAN